jgi:hypothetical protein
MVTTFKLILVISEPRGDVVAVEINTNRTFLRPDEIETLLDLYAEQYAYPREGLKGRYMPLVDLQFAITCWGEIKRGVQSPV